MPANGQGLFSKKPGLATSVSAAASFRTPSVNCNTPAQTIGEISHAKNPLMIQIFLPKTPGDTAVFKTIDALTLGTVRKTDLPTVAIGLHETGRADLRTLIVKIANVPGVSIPNETIPWLAETLQAFRAQHQSRHAAALLAATAQPVA